MMGFGFLFILVVLAILVIGAIAVVAWFAASRRGGSSLNVMQPAVKQSPAAGPEGNRFCSHCGAGLHDGWTYCPQCGAPVA